MINFIIIREILVIIHNGLIMKVLGVQLIYRALITITTKNLTLEERMSATHEHMSNPQMRMVC